MLTNSKRPIDGIFRWDFDRLINRLEHKLNVAMVPSLSDQPEVVIAQWNVIKFGSRLRLTGYVEGVARITSWVESFDLSKMLVITTSGRRYWLCGAPHRCLTIEANQGWAIYREKQLLESWV
jgi:hypothetical protein